MDEEDSRGQTLTMQESVLPSINFSGHRIAYYI